MQQADFRRLVQSSARPAPSASSSGGGGGGDGDGERKNLKEQSWDWIKSFDKERKKEKRRAQQSAHRHEIEQERRREKSDARMEEEEAAIATHQYRDRAKERRGVEGEADAETAAQLESLTAEESKLLSGDVEYTGLVRGLDFVLLRKTREEQEAERKKEEEREKEEKKEEEAPPEPALFASTHHAEDHAATVCQAMDMSDSLQPAIARSSMARGVLRNVEERRYPDSIDMFLPGRTLLRFATTDVLAAGQASSDLPVTQFRSHSDCPVAEDHVAIDVSDKVMAVLRSKMPRGKKKRKGKKRAAPPAAVSLPADDGLRLIPLRIDRPPDPPTEAEETRMMPPPVSSDALPMVRLPPPPADDIFADAGREYVCDAVEKLEAELGSVRKRRREEEEERRLEEEREMMQEEKEEEDEEEEEREERKEEEEEEEEEVEMELDVQPAKRTRI